MIASIGTHQRIPDPFINEQDCVCSDKRLQAVRHPQYSDKRLLKKTKCFCLLVVRSQSPLLQWLCWLQYL